MLSSNNYGFTMDSEAPSCSSDVKLSEQDRALISQANNEFVSANYEDCLWTLAKLEQSMGTNRRIRHNRAVVEFYKSGCKNYDVLLYQLENLSLPEAGATNSTTLGTNVVSSSPVAVYNIAVVNLYKHKLNTAIGALFPLIDKLSDLDEEISVAIALLMLHLLLRTNQVNSARALLDLIQTQFGRCSDGVPSRESVLLYKVANRELSGNFKFMSMQTLVLSKDDVNVVDDTPETAVLKAHQYYLMNDFQMASKQLMKINSNNFSPEDRRDLHACIANNMGVIHLRVRHYAIAAKFLQDALRFDKKLIPDVRTATLLQLGDVRVREILYNLGIAMLHLRRPREAFKCFLVPARTYHSNPRLWLRLAESCIMNYEMNCSAKTTKLYIPSDLYSGKEAIINRQEPSLEFALLCLRSSLSLVSFYKTEMSAVCDQDTKKQSLSWGNIKDSNFCNPSMPVSKDSFNVMLSAIHAAYCYVSLQLGDCAAAYEAALDLLKVEDLSDAYRLLAHTYAGEALAMMNRFADARRCFEPSLYSSLNANDFETKNWAVNSLEAARAIVRYNLVVVMLMQGDYAVAGNLLRTCSHPIVASKVLNLKNYLKAAGIGN